LGSEYGGSFLNPTASILMQQQAYQDVIVSETTGGQTEMYESVGRDVDFDQRNEENMAQMYSRFSITSTHQIAQHT
jgi:hypothetical protein